MVQLKRQYWDIQAILVVNKLFMQNTEASPVQGLVQILSFPASVYKFFTYE